MGSYLPRVGPRSAVALVIVSLGLAASAPAQAPTRENFLILIADDLGVDKVGAYASGECIDGVCPNPPSTPAIDTLAAEGLLFRNAYANPVCSTTRATALTGLYAFRNGVGGFLRGGGDATSKVAGLDPSTPNVANLLRDAGYDTAAFGKWHMAGCDVTHPDCPGGDELPIDRLHAIRSGFNYFAGSLANIRDYCHWPKVIAHRDPETQEPELVSEDPSTTYTTTDTVEEAIEKIDADGIADLSEPWLAWVAFNAVHEPLHMVPQNVYDCDEEYTSGSGLSEVGRYAGMTAHMDLEIKRLLDAIPASAREHTTIIFMGDNGTYAEVIEPPFDPQRNKGTIYEGGINVPFIVQSPRLIEVGNEGAETASLVQATDIAATVLDIAARFDPELEATVPADSSSATASLEDPSVSSPRTHAYSESFFPNNGSPPYTEYDIAIRDGQHKLVLHQNVDLSLTLELYDLASDPLESRNLYDVFEGDSDPEIQGVSDGLRSAVASINGSYPLGAVTLGDAMAHDLDADGICDGAVSVPGVCAAGPDNCVWLANVSQLDANGNGVGDICEDADDDGVIDLSDNCVLGGEYGGEQTNPDQCDRDEDGFGNLCDADYDNNLWVGFPDLMILSRAYPSQEGDSNWNPVVDMNCDGGVGMMDYVLFLKQLNGAPGPSGLFCAGDSAQQPCRDADGDEIRDEEDNCTEVFNATQCDENGDGFGNHCDADLNNDGVVSMLDLFPFWEARGFQEGDSNWNPEADLDCDGDVDGEFSDPPGADTDGALFGASLAVGSPGPSGLACAGDPPCPAP
jgi:arylsulfatase A-like enzyme